MTLSLQWILYGWIWLRSNQRRETSFSSPSPTAGRNFKIFLIKIDAFFLEFFQEWSQGELCQWTVISGPKVFTSDQGNPEPTKDQSPQFHPDLPENERYDFRSRASVAWNSSDKFPAPNLEVPQGNHRKPEGWNSWGPCWTFERDDLLGEWFMGDLQGIVTQRERGRVQPESKPRRQRQRRRRRKQCLWSPLALATIQHQRMKCKKTSSHLSSAPGFLVPLANRLASVRRRLSQPLSLQCL